MEKCNYRKDPHQDIDHVFRDLLPAHGMVERPAQVELSHQMLDTMLNGIHALTFGLGQHIFRLGKAVLSQLGGAFAVFWLSSHGFNSSSKIFLRNSSTISAARFCISLVVWVGVLGERRPGMSQDSRQSLYIYTRCQRMGGKSVVQTMKPDIRQLRPF